MLDSALLSACQPHPQQSTASVCTAARIVGFKTWIRTGEQIGQDRGCGTQSIEKAVDLDAWMSLGLQVVRLSLSYGS
ncbi:hypothetical protein U9M48_012584 [Paspalum notatum var. saurae]|uniref:Uncharacterized protein n=1 Tax=Paspalum notatum var. saurae TaxID=547442 RepID=A0AAQ3WIJ5_PASNO